jgi:hypothetical protein
MSEKIAVFYSIAQVNEWWSTEFFKKQMSRLTDSGLYDSIDFIDISIGHDHLPLPFIPNKTRNITYGKEYLDNSKEFSIRIWEFCKNNPNYKILNFHSLGVSWTQTHQLEKAIFRNYLETILIDNWFNCVQLLDYYDLVGTDLVPEAVFYNGYSPDDHENKDKWTRFYAPHFQGGFWWSKSNYISQLDPEFLNQDVNYKRYLPELWIGTANPAICNMYSSTKNHYREIITFPKEEIFKNCVEHLNQLRNK